MKKYEANSIEEAIKMLNGVKCFFQVGQKVSYEVGYHKEVCTVKEIRKDGLIVVEDEFGNQFGTTENRLFIVFNPAE